MAKRLWFGMLVTALAFGMMVTGCDNSSGGGGGGGGTFGNTLSLSGQVWEMDWDDGPNFIRFEGDSTIIASPLAVPPGEGAIAGGQFTFSIGIPIAGALQPVSGLIDRILDANWEDVSIIPATHTARAAVLALQTPHAALIRVHESESASSGSWEYVYFIYVDQDITVSAPRIFERETFEGGFSLTFEARAFNLRLREGWNAIHARGEWRDTATTQSDTFSVSLGNPSRLRWVMGDDWRPVSEPLEFSVSEQGDRASLRSRR